MKVFCLLIFLGLPLTSTAQKASTPTASNLLVIDYKLGPIVRVDVSRSESFPRLEEQGSSSSATEINPPDYRWQVKAKLKLRNTGVSTIKSFRCGLILMANVNGTRTSQGITMRFHQAIRSGDTVTVNHVIRGFDLKVWSRSQKDGLLDVFTDISRIEYSDGSVWEGPPFKLPWKN